MSPASWSGVSRDEPTQRIRPLRAPRPISFATSDAIDADTIVEGTLLDADPTDVDHADHSDAAFAASLFVDPVSSVGTRPAAAAE